jgi:hypothetical protein
MSYTNISGTTALTTTQRDNAEKEWTMEGAIEEFDEPMINALNKWYDSRCVKTIERPAASMTITCLKCESQKCKEDLLFHMKRFRTDMWAIEEDLQRPRSQDSSYTTELQLESAHNGITRALTKFQKSYCDC